MQVVFFDVVGALLALSIRLDIALNNFLLWFLALALVYLKIKRRKQTK
jgi:hypothetical protein